MHIYIVKLYVRLRLLQLDTLDSSILAKKLENILILEGNGELLDVEVSEWVPLLRSFSFSLGYLFMLALEFGHLEAIREFLHARVVPL